MATTQVHKTTTQAHQIRQPDGFNYEALTMALVVLVERIRQLPKDDRDDLYELMKELPNAETPEEVESIFVAMREILDQKPITMRQIEQTVECQPGAGLRKWIDFVSERIRTLRKEAGLTQTELAEKSGLPQSHVSRLENGEHSPSRTTLEKIAKALKVPVSKLDPSA